MTHWKKIVSLCLVFAVIACGGNSSNDDDGPIPAEKTPDIQSETEPASDTTIDLEVQSLENVGNAMLKIVGDENTPDSTAYTFESAGFIIDSSGLALTNSYIVMFCKPESLKAFVNGENTPRSVKVLGFSECAGLAVLDIEGDDFHYLQWNEGEVNTDQNVYAFGYQRDAYDVIETQGVISSPNTDGGMPWTSTPDIIIHDAAIDEYGSGGPLVDDTGKVIGVNYCFASSNDYYTIPATQAMSVFENIASGHPYPSLGIISEVITLGDISTTFVYAVIPGSPADIAGIKEQDYIVFLYDRLMAESGTAREYCSFLENYSENELVDIVILRIDTQTGESLTLEGQINGAPLTEVVFDDPVPTNFMTINDASGELQVDVPAVWTDIVSDDWIFEDETIGPSITVSNGDFWQYWSAPGIFVAKSDRLADFGITDEKELLKRHYPGVLENACTFQGQAEYQTSRYHGYLDLFTNCSEEVGSTIFHFAGSPESGDYMVISMIQFVNDGNVELVDRILESIIVAD